MDIQNDETTHLKQGGATSTSWTNVRLKKIEWRWQFRLGIQNGGTAYLKRGGRQVNELNWHTLKKIE